MAGLKLSQLLKLEKWLSDRFSPRVQQY